MSDSDSKSTSSNEPGVFEVESLLNRRVIDGTTFYLIKWLGYPESESTWEPENNLGDNCAKLIKAYNMKQSHAKRAATRKQRDRPRKASPNRPKRKGKQEQDEGEYAGVAGFPSEPVRVTSRKTAARGRVRYLVECENGESVWRDLASLDDFMELVEIFEHAHTSQKSLPQETRPAIEISQTSDEDQADDEDNTIDIIGNDDVTYIRASRRNLAGTIEDDEDSIVANYTKHIDPELDGEISVQKSPMILNSPTEDFRSNALPESRLNANRCSSCDGRQTRSQQLYSCHYCSLSFHEDCISAPLAKHLGVSGQGDVKFTCAYCLKEKPLCRKCDFDVDPEVDGDQNMFRCYRCLRPCHWQCLMELGAEILDRRKKKEERWQIQALSNNDHMISNNIFSKPPWSDFNCWDCRRFAADPEQILDRRTDPTGTVEYLVKFKNVSFWWTRWVTKDWLSCVSKLHLSYESRDDSEGKDDEKRMEEYSRIDRVLDGEKIVYRDGHYALKAFVKWQGQNYDSCTWEIITDQDDPERMDEMRQALKKWIKTEKVDSKNNRKMRAETSAEQVFEEQTEPPSFVQGNSLYDFQMDGFNWLLYKWSNNTSCILADDMGLGKTIQTLCAIGYITLHHGHFPHLILVPNATLNNWKQEMDKWVSELNYVVYTGSKEARSIISEYDLYSASSFSVRGRKRYLKHHIVLTTFDYVHRDVTFFQNVDWESIIVDEGHRLKDRTSKLFNVLMGVKSVRWKLLLTGTPFQNTITECLNLLYFLSPETFGDISAWENKYEHIDKNNLEELQAILRERMLKRLKENVRRDLIPDKVERIVPVGISALQKDLYGRILAKNLTYLRHFNKLKYARKTSLINILMELRKLLNHPYLVQGGYHETEEMDAEPQRMLIESSGKLYLLHSLLAKLKKRGNRVLIFSTLRIMLDILEQYVEGEGYSYCRLDGEMTADQKQRQIEIFNDPNSEAFVFLISTRAGGLGINLSSADTIILYDADFNPHMDLQALSRAHRIGQTKKLLVLRLVTKDTVEERILELAARKLALGDLLVQKFESELKNEDIESILRFGVESILKPFDNDSEKDGKCSLPIFEDADLEALIDINEDPMEDVVDDKGNAAQQIYSFAKVWNIDQRQRKSNSMELEQEPSLKDGESFWDRLLRERWELENMRELEAKSSLGRIDGRSSRIQNMDTKEMFIEDVDELSEPSSYVPSDENQDEMEIDDKTLSKSLKDKVDATKLWAQLGNFELHLIAAQCHLCFSLCISAKPVPPGWYSIGNKVVICTECKKCQS